MRHKHIHHKPESDLDAFPITKDKPGKPVAYPPSDFSYTALFRSTIEICFVGIKVALLSKKISFRTSYYTSNLS